MTRRVVSHIIDAEKRIKDCIPTRLKESLHEFNTQKNEAMNASITKYAPKTKTYGMTISLTNRVMIAIGINVYNKLDITMAPETVSFLQSQEKSRFYRKK